MNRWWNFHQCRPDLFFDNLHLMHGVTRQARPTLRVSPLAEELRQRDAKSFAELAKICAIGLPIVIEVEHRCAKPEECAKHGEVRRIHSGVAISVAEKAEHAGRAARRKDVIVAVRTIAVAVEATTGV